MTMQLTPQHYRFMFNIMWDTRNE